MAWYLVKRRDNFTVGFTLPLIKVLHSVLYWITWDYKRTDVCHNCDYVLFKHPFIPRDKPSNLKRKVSYNKWRNCQLIVALLLRFFCPVSQSNQLLDFVFGWTIVAEAGAGTNDSVLSRTIPLLCVKPIWQSNQIIGEISRHQPPGLGMFLWNTERFRVLEVFWSFSF
jgi:hypothetical protein